MTDKQLISTIKYVAGTKPVFLLSEIVPYLEKKHPVLGTIRGPSMPGGPADLFRSNK